MSDYAPDPKKQQVFTNLQNKTLADVTALDIQRLTDPTFIQATNQDALLTYNMVNKAAMRDGSPMPDTGLIKAVSQTVDGNVTVTVFRPAVGEVYQLTGASTGTLTGTRIELFISDGTNNVEIGAETAGATQFDPFGSAPVYIDNNVFLNTFLIGGTGTMAVAVSMIRIR